MCHSSPPPRTGHYRHWRLALSCYSLTLVPVLLGALIGKDDNEFIPRSDSQRLLNRLTAVDGFYYRQIADHGYSYVPGERSVVAFFPIFPSISALVRSIFGVDTRVALLLVSHLSLALLLFVTSRYLEARETDLPQSSDRLRIATLLTFGLWPAAAFFRFAYSESLFALLCITTLLGMKLNWRPIILACLAGLASATRPVGFVLSATLMIHLARKRRELSLAPLSLMLLSLVSISGLLVYALYLGNQFGDPLAFARTQTDWVAEPHPWSQKIVPLLSFRPIWAAFNSQSEYFWNRNGTTISPIFTIEFLDPVFWTMAVTAIVYGRYKSWLDNSETFLSLGLLLVPYVLMACDNRMQSQARFSTLALAQYFVYGRLLVRLPTPLLLLVFTLLGCWLGMCTHLFAFGGRFY